MGTIFTVRPLSQVSPPVTLSWQQQMDLLTEWGLPVPLEPVSSRYPTPEDVQAVFSEWRGLEASYEQNVGEFWAYGWPEYGPTVAVCVRADGTGSREHLLGGVTIHDTPPEMVVETVERLARRCGPLLVAEYDEFLVVQAGTPPDHPWLS